MINMDITDKRAKFDNDNDVITLYKMKPSTEQREENNSNIIKETGRIWEYYNEMNV